MSIFNLDARVDDGLSAELEVSGSMQLSLPGSLGRYRKLIQLPRDSRMPTYQRRSRQSGRLIKESRINAWYTEYANRATMD